MTLNNICDINFSKLSERRITSYLDYLNAGLQISLIASIDFTSSNQQPYNRYSLH